MNWISCPSHTVLIQLISPILPFSTRLTGMPSIAKVRTRDGESKSLVLNAESTMI
jgi:hypothetical protein